MPHLRDDSRYYAMHGRDQGCGAEVCPGRRSCCCPSHNSTKRGLCLGSFVLVPQGIVNVARHSQDRQSDGGPEKVKSLRLGLRMGKLTIDKPLDTMCLFVC